jgi:superfamily II DNA or RNA helicase
MSTDVNVYIENNVYFRIEAERGILYELKEYFSAYIPNHKFHPKVKQHLWNGKISLFEIYDRLLPIGLYKNLKKFLKYYNYTYKYHLTKDDLINDIPKDVFTDFYKQLFKGTTIYPRDYQQEAIEQSLIYKRGVVEAATGAGKSIVIYSIIRFIKETVDGNILIVVPNIGLVTQLFDDFKTYGWNDSYDYVSLLYGKSKYDPNKKITISTWQSIYKKHEQFFEKFNAVIVDETHMAKTTSIKTILTNCVNAEYRIGLTGTLPTDKLEKMTIVGYLGPTIFKLMSKSLIDGGFLSNIEIMNMKLRYKKEEVELVRSMTYAEEVDFIINHSRRNNIFKYIIDSNFVDNTHNILILAQRISHIDNIVEYLTTTYEKRTVFRIDGSTSAEERDSIRNNIEHMEGVILVATYGTLSTGINIPKLHHVVLGSFYKSKIKILQSIGRGLRKHYSKERIIIWDIIDDLRYDVKRRNTGNIEKENNYAYSHFLERVSYYKEQQFTYSNNKITI